MTSFIIFHHFFVSLLCAVHTKQTFIDNEQRSQTYLTNRASETPPKQQEMYSALWPVKILNLFVTNSAPIHKYELKKLKLSFQIFQAKKFFPSTYQVVSDEIYLFVHHNFFSSCMLYDMYV